MPILFILKKKYKDNIKCMGIRATTFLGSFVNIIITVGIPLNQIVVK